VLNLPAASIHDHVEENRPERAASDRRTDRPRRRLWASGRPAAAISRIQRLARWYSRRAGWVSEHEIRTFLIVPLPLALGWPEQRINIEYEHADIAV
jgi:hypothetical protein